MKNSKLQIGEQIKKFRVRRGLTQNDLAEKIGLTEKQISKIETGVHYPKFENFVKIMEVLNVDMKDFDCESISKKNSSELNSIFKTLNRATDEELKYYYKLVKQLENMFNEFSRRN